MEKEREREKKNTPFITVFIQGNDKSAVDVSVISCDLMVRSSEEKRIFLLRVAC